MALLSTSTASSIYHLDEAIGKVCIHTDRQTDRQTHTHTHTYTHTHTTVGNLTE